MIKELVSDEAILSQPCEPATADDADLAQDLVDTIATLEEAACLAANQIGVAKAVAVYLDEDDEVHVIYNPKFLRGLGAFKTFEGCMTREDESKVTRYERIKVTYDEMHDGELRSQEVDLRGWTAQVVQHIIDHCKGKLV